MPIPSSICIAGAGLAGACAAFVLSEHADVTVLEADAPASGASSAAAGLVNPLMGRRANPVWRLREALDAVPTLLDRADAMDVFQNDGVLRPTTEAKQVQFFQDAVQAHPGVAEWMPEAQVREQFPDVTTVDGAMRIPGGGAVDVPAMVHRLLDAATARGATVETGVRVTGWTDVPNGAALDVVRDGTSDRVRADCVLLCLGQGYPGFDELEALGLTGVKGQTVRVERPPESSTGPLLPMSGHGYVVPEPDGTLTIGSSYTHDFDDLTPEPSETTYILEKTSKMLPGIDAMTPLSVTAGVRVKQAQTNQPVVGPMPGREHVWTFTALGSKGLLTAPLLSLELPDYLRDAAPIPPQVSTQTAVQKS